MVDQKLYQKAYSFFEGVTPLEYDCGTLCEGACCRGDSRRGMYLFPGEEDMFPGQADAWYDISETSIFLSTGHTVKLLTCRGECPREERPLSCRLFPLMPYLTDDDLVELRLDPKGMSICPIGQKNDEYTIDDSFIDAAYDALEVLVRDEEVLEFISLLSDDYDAMNRLI